VSEDGGSGAGGVATPGGIGHENSHHERVRILASSPGIVVPPRDDDTTMSVGGGSSVGRGGGSIGLSADERHQYHPRSQRHHHHRDSHTLPNFAMESVSHDQMPFAHGEVRCSLCACSSIHFGVWLHLVEPLIRFYNFEDKEDPLCPWGEFHLSVCLVFLSLNDGTS